MTRWLLLLLLIAGPAQADEAAWRAFLQPGTHAIMRHAEAPGTGDPPGFRLDDCATQRNLSAAGRVQAARIGAAIRARRVPVTTVLTSQWCRATDTARLLGLGTPRVVPALNSIFAQPDAEVSATAALKAALAKRGKSLLVSHQVNITALTGVFPASGEIVVFSLSSAGAVRVEGRIVPGD